MNTWRKRLEACGDYIHIYIYIYEYIHIYIYIWIYIYIFTYSYLFIDFCILLSIYIYSNLSILLCSSKAVQTQLCKIVQSNWWICGEWTICFTNIAARVRRSIVHASLRKVWKCFHTLLNFTLSIKSHIPDISYQMYTLSHVIYTYIYIHIIYLLVQYIYIYIYIYYFLSICHMYIYDVYTWCVYYLLSLPWQETA